MQSESTILAFTFAVSTFLSSIENENGSNSTASDVFVMFNVGGLHNLDKISGNWLDVSGNPCVKYTLNVS